VIELLVLLIPFLFALAVMGAIADGWDAREARRDAHRRNHVSRR
jgi:hypothetical protein